MDFYKIDNKGEHCSFQIAAVFDNRVTLFLTAQFHNSSSRERKKEAGMAVLMKSEAFSKFRSF